ncbi:MAG: hypothetical protein R2911_43465 [Caldilineaceae bacterium]
MARLYPETGDALSGSVAHRQRCPHSHVFDLADPVPAVYVQLWVNEAPDGLDTPTRW